MDMVFLIQWLQTLDYSDIIIAVAVAWVPYFFAARERYLKLDKAWVKSYSSLSASTEYLLNSTPSSAVIITDISKMQSELEQCTDDIQTSMVFSPWTKKKYRKKADDLIERSSADRDVIWQRYMIRMKIDLYNTTHNRPLF